MMAMGAMAMDDGPKAGGQIGRVMLLVGATLGLLFGTGMIIGILAAHSRHGGPIGLELGAILAATALLAAGSGFVLWRATRAMAKASGPATPRERRNWIVLTVCGALGGGMGLAMSLAGSTPFAAFNNEPLPTALAVILALLIGVLLPILSVYWHRQVADEQESAAYNKGALIGIYVYWIGAPTWWLLWRGGLVPAPDGILIYFTTIAVTGAIWLWAKYR